MKQSDKDAQFIIDIGLATGVTVQCCRDGENFWFDRIIDRKYAPPSDNYRYRIKPSTDPDEGPES